MNWEELNKKAGGKTPTVLTSQKKPTSWEELNSLAITKTIPSSDEFLILKQGIERKPVEDNIFKKIARFVLPAGLETKFGLREPTIEEEMMEQEKAREDYYGYGEDLIGGVATLGKGLTKLPKAMAAAVLQATQGREGASVVDKDWADRYIEEANTDLNKFINEVSEKYKKKTLISGIPLKITDIAEFPQSLAFSLTSMGAGLGTGVPVGLLPVPGARVAAWSLGTAASGAVAYNMTTYQIVQQFLEAKDEEKREKTGQGLTLEEENELKDLFGAKAMKYGLWEAVPEAISNLAFLKILTAPLSRIIGKNMASKVLNKIAGLYGEELLTETITQKGQSDIEVEAGLRENKISWTEAFKEIAPQTFLLTTIMAGAGATIIKSKDAVTRIKSSLKKEIGISHPLYQEIDSNIEKGLEVIKNPTRPRAETTPKAIPEAPPIAQKATKLGVPAEKGIIPRELEPLAKEARKYKSAAEFVRAQPEIIEIKEGISELKNRLKKPVYRDDPVSNQAIRSRIVEEEELLNKTKSQLTDFYNQAVKGVEAIKPEEIAEIKPTRKAVPREQLPVGEGKKAISRLADRMLNKLEEVGKKIKETDLLSFRQLNKKEQMTKALEYVSDNPTEAMKVLLGKKPAPKGLLYNAIALASEELAANAGDAQLALQLASLRSTRMGQEISLLTEADPNSPVRFMYELSQQKINAFGGQEKFQLIKKAEVSEMKQQIRKAATTKNEWQSFIDSLKC